MGLAATWFPVLGDFVGMIIDVSLSALNLAGGMVCDPQPGNPYAHILCTHARVANIANISWYTSYSASPARPVDDTLLQRHMNARKRRSSMAAIHPRGIRALTVPKDTIG